MDPKTLSAGGARDGDPFVFHLKHKDGSRQELSGLVQQLPGSVQQWVDDLVGLWKGLDKLPLGEAFLRSASVVAERLTQLRRAGTPKLVLIQDCPADVQPLLRAAFARPLDFVALSKADHESLEKFGQLFFVVQEKAAWQLTLFGARK